MAKKVSPKHPSIASLQALIDRYRLNLSDLKEEVGSKSTVSLILSGKRNLTRTHIEKLSARFKVNPAVFFDPLQASVFIGKRPHVPRRNLFDPQVEPEDAAEEALLADVAIKANRRATVTQKALLTGLHAAIQRAIASER